MKQAGDNKPLNQFMAIVDQKNKAERKIPQLQQQGQIPKGPESQIARDFREAKKLGWGEKDDQQN